MVKLNTKDAYMLHHYQSAGEMLYKHLFCCTAGLFVEAVLLWSYYVGMTRRIYPYRYSVMDLNTGGHKNLGVYVINTTMFITLQTYFCLIFKIYICKLIPMFHQYISFVIKYHLYWKSRIVQESFSKILCPLVVVLSSYFTPWELPADWSKGISYDLLNQSERV